MPENVAPKRIGLLVFPEFSMMALAAASEPFRAANRLARETLYQCVYVSIDGATVQSSSGVELKTVPAEQSGALDRLFVIASLRIEELRDPKVNRFLQRLAYSGCVVGAISTGTFVLARAGLLAGYRCTLHWEALRQFAEEFPNIEVCRELYVRDRNRWTCAGGTAGIDLMLAQIAADHGSQLAADSAEQFLHNRIRGPEEHQRMAVEWRYGVSDARIAAAIACMEQNLENLVPIDEIAKRCRLSLRQLERLWHQHFGTTPQRFYLNVRLNEARRLLRESTETIASIAIRCGFVSPSHLGSAYRTRYGHTPSNERHGTDQLS